jgi:hypothetical protein
MRIKDIISESKSMDDSTEILKLPDIEVGDAVKVGKFKNRKATVTGFKKDDHNQPVLKTTKGDHKLFKPRVSKLEESVTATLYHGDNFGTTKLNPAWMYHGESNNQEGIGIYFSPDIDVARHYGTKISTTSLEGYNVVDSRTTTDDVVNRDGAIQFIEYLNSQDDDFWYLISNYIEVANPEDIEEYHFAEVYDAMRVAQIRHWQIELMTSFSSIEKFVSGWNKYIQIDALYDYDTQFYAIINPSIEIRPHNF